MCHLLRCLQMLMTPTPFNLSAYDITLPRKRPFSCATQWWKSTSSLCLSCHSHVGHYPPQYLPQMQRQVLITSVSPSYKTACTDIKLISWRCRSGHQFSERFTHMASTPWPLSRHTPWMNSCISTSHPNSSLRVSAPRVLCD